jgi:hypothetical protein
MVIVFLRRFVCPRQGSNNVLSVSSATLLVFGTALWIFNLLTLLEVDTVPTLELMGMQVRAFVGEYVMAGFAGLGFVLGLSGFLSIVGIRMMSSRILLCVWLAWVILLLAQLIAVLLLSYWIYALDDLPNQSLKVLQGTASGGRYEGMLGSKALTEVEGFVCQTYRKCCRDPMLDLQLAEGSTPPPEEDADESGSGAPGSGVFVEVDYNRTCVQQHEGTASDVAISLEDPSREGFCPYVVGSQIRIAPPTGICNPLNHVFPLATCQENFCLTGPEGYFDFVLNLVAFVRYYGVTVIGIVGFIVLVQSVLIINLWNMRQRFRGRRDGYDDKGYQMPRGPDGKVMKRGSAAYEAEVRRRSQIRASQAKEPGKRFSSSASGSYTRRHAPCTSQKSVSVLEVSLSQVE